MNRFKNSLAQMEQAIPVRYWESDGFEWLVMTNHMIADEVPFVKRLLPYIFTFYPSGMCGEQMRDKMEKHLEKTGYVL